MGIMLSALRMTFDWEEKGLGMAYEYTNGREAGSMHPKQRHISYKVFLLNGQYVVSIEGDV